MAPRYQTQPPRVRIIFFRHLFCTFLVIPQRGFLWTVLTGITSIYIVIWSISTGVVRCKTSESYTGKLTSKVGGPWRSTSIVFLLVFLSFSRRLLWGGVLTKNNKLRYHRAYKETKLHSWGPMFSGDHAHAKLLLKRHQEVVFNLRRDVS